MYETFLLWTFVTVCVSFVNTETYESFISRTGPELCPYSTFCKQGPTERLTGKRNIPCCTPCSCEDDCWMNDNCCPDHQSQQTTTPKSFMKCMIPIQFSSNRYNSAHALGNTSVYTVTSCPADYPDNDVSKMCAGSKTIDDLRDQATVSDRIGRVYRNRHCATCHGKRDVKVWEQGLACQKLVVDLIDGVTMLERDALQNAECVVYSVAPVSDKLVQHNLLVQQYQCYHYQYETCNETGRWDIYNEHIERACAAYTGSYGQFRMKTGMTWYKNPFCFLCNNKVTESISSTCPREDTGIKIVTYSMHSLLSVRQPHRSSRPTVCKLEEIYDKYFDTCRILHCPIGQSAVDGRCHDVFQYIDGMEIAAVFVVTMESTNHNASMDSILADSDQLQEINALLLTNLKINLTYCYACPSYIVHDAVYNDRFQIYVILRSKKSCSLDTILDTFYVAYKDDVSFTLTHEGGALKFIGRLTFDMYIPLGDVYQFDRYTWARVLSWKSAEGACYRYMVLKDFFYCPFVDLSRSDYQHLMNDTNSRLDADHFTLVNQDTGHAVTNRSHGNSKASVYRVCTRNYIPVTVNGVTKPANSSFLCVLVLFGTIYPTR